MAATAHASLVSLLNTLDQIQTHPTFSTCFDKHQFQSLREIVDFLVDFVENYSKEAEDLMRPIGDAAHEAEDVIEVEAADLIRGESPFALLHLEKIMQEMSSIKEKVIKVKDESGYSIISMHPPPPPPSPRATKKITMLGFDGYMAQLLDELTGHDSHRRILPIVGMGGAGKTTLAKSVYENSLVLYHFDVRAWVTVSQEYSATHMLSQALSCFGQSGNITDDELGIKLHKYLFGRRYLIVLDDMWSVEAWEKIQNFFPENGNGSRIIVTTRQQELVDYFGSSSLAVGFLDYENSWNLFCEVTFAEQKCPPQLEGIAEKIVRKCKGLPLAILVLGGLLGKGPRTQEHWEEIAKDKSLVMEYSGDGNKPYNILYMSYKYMPVWLRSCFLYMGLFPEDHLIDVSRLIKLWVAEGFIKPTENQTLEQVAESYIKELVDRNLLLVGKSNEYNKVLSYCLHDLVRELCIKTANIENFYCVQRDIGGGRHFICDERSTSFYPQESLISFSEKPSIIRPLVLMRGQREEPLKYRLLRVLVDDDSCLDPSFQQVNMRYISQNHSPKRPPIPWSISLCWSLQTLIVGQDGIVILPSKIWRMPQLRHIEAYLLHIPDPDPDEIFVLHNLQTLKSVEDLIFTEKLCAKIPNVRELEIVYNFFEEQGWSSHLHNVGRLSKLESLSCSCRCIEKPYGNLSEYLKLPNSIMDLTLDNCFIAWSDMTTIASLPHLQLLQLKRQAVVGTEWKFAKEEFRNLKHLTIWYNYDLTNWIAAWSNFPVLETLYLHCPGNQVEIPLDIGEIPTLDKISVYRGSMSTMMSAIMILEQQESLGNQALHVHIHSGDRQIFGLYESTNLHFSACG